VTFGGRYETSWTEGTLHWGSSRIFFSECTTIIKDRNIGEYYLEKFILYEQRQKYDLAPGSKVIVLKR